MICSLILDEKGDLPQRVPRHVQLSNGLLYRPPMNIKVSPRRCLSCCYRLRSHEMRSVRTA